MITEEQVTGLLESHGYEKREHGWVRDNPKGVSQVVTPFPNSEFQLFGWPTDPEDADNLYSTGIVMIEEYSHLVALLIVFDQYKHIDWRS